MFLSFVYNNLVLVHGELDWKRNVSKHLERRNTLRSSGKGGRPKSITFSSFTSFTIVGTKQTQAALHILFTLTNVSFY